MYKKIRDRSCSRSSNEEPLVKRPRMDPEDVAGIIRRIKFTNFMNHSSLEIEPNRHINFIVGHNGAGKSSLLQGLVLGLAGIAKSTKRYSKTGEFIKFGESKAEIEITLCNEGEDAYKPEVYGDSIIFARTFRENGTSLRLKNANGEVMKSVSREARLEGDAILQQFKIEIDNPICILQQEMAKEMLRVEKPEKLFKYVREATLMKRCQELYSEAENNLRETENKIVKLNEILEARKGELRERREKLRSIEEKLEKRNKEGLFRNESLWAKVWDFRDEIASLEIKIRETAGQINVIKDKIKEDNQCLDQELSKKEEIEQKLASDRRAENEEEVKWNRLRFDQDLLKKEIKMVSFTLTELNQNISALENEQRELQKRLIDESKSVSRTRPNKAEQRRRRMETIDARLNEIQLEITHEIEKQEKVTNDEQKHSSELRDIEKQKSYVKEDFARQKKYLDELNGLCNDQSLEVYGREAVEVEKLISESSGKFKHKPIGPVGKFVNLAGDAAGDKGPGRLIENEIGQFNLRGYLCDNQQDARVLIQIFKRVYPAGKQLPKIFSSRFLTTRHRVNEPERGLTAPPGYHRLMDYLQVDRVEVFNHLVDEHSIERILVARTGEEASRLTTHKRDVPLNLKKIITQDGYRYFPAPAYRTYYIPEMNAPSLLLKCHSDRLKNQIQLMEKLKDKLKELSERILEAEADLKLAQMAKEKWMNENKKLREEEGSLRQEKSKLKTEEAEEMENNNIQDIEKKLEANKKSLEELKIQMGEKNTVKKEKSQQLTTISKKISQRKVYKQRPVNNPLEKEYAEIETNIKKLKLRISNNEEAVILAINHHLKKHQKSKSDQEIKLTKALSDARKCTKGVEMNIPKQRRAAVRANYEQAMKITMTPAEVKDYELLKESADEDDIKIKKMAADLAMKIGIVKELTLTQNSRRTNFYTLVSVNNGLIEREFKDLSNQMFGQSNYSMEMGIMRNKIEFHFTDSKGRVLRDKCLDSLSGGEKSALQMAFIMSLWSSTNPPFRALDEWDVYLDAVNRQKIVEKMLSLIIDKDKQFFFISPLGSANLAGITTGQRKRISIINIHK